MALSWQQLTSPHFPIPLQITFGRHRTTLARGGMDASISTMALDAASRVCRSNSMSAWFDPATQVLMVSISGCENK